MTAWSLAPMDITEPFPHLRCFALIVASFSCCLFVSLFAISFILGEVKCMHSKWVEIWWLIWPLKNTQFLCQTLWNAVLSAFSWIWADGIALYTSEFRDSLPIILVQVHLNFILSSNLAPELFRCFLAKHNEAKLQKNVSLSRYCNSNPVHILLSMDGICNRSKPRGRTPGLKDLSLLSWNASRDCCRFTWKTSQGSYQTPCNLTEQIDWWRMQSTWDCTLSCNTSTS